MERNAHGAQRVQHKALSTQRAQHVKQTEKQKPIMDQNYRLLEEN